MIKPNRSRDATPSTSPEAAAESASADEHQQPAEQRSTDASLLSISTEELRNFGESSLEEGECSKTSSSSSSSSDESVDASSK